MKWSKGDKLKVINPAAPFAGYTPVVDAVFEGDPFPIWAKVEIDDRFYEVSYRLDEIERLPDTNPTEEIPAVVA